MRLTCVLLSVEEATLLSPNVCMTGKLEVSWNRVESSVLPTNRELRQRSSFYRCQSTLTLSQRESRLHIILGRRQSARIAVVIIDEGLEQNCVQSFPAR